MDPLQPRLTIEPSSRSGTPPPPNLATFMQDMSTNLALIQSQLQELNARTQGQQAAIDDSQTYRRLPSNAPSEGSERMPSSPTFRTSRARAFGASRSQSPDHFDRLSSSDSRSIADVVRNLDPFDGTVGAKAKHWLINLHEATQSLYLLKLGPADDVERFFLTLIAMKFKGTAHTWFQQFKHARPQGHRLSELCEEFKRHFISSHEVVLLARTNFWNLHDRARSKNMSVKDVYHTMLALLDEIRGNDPPAVSDQIMQFLKCVTDEYIRAEARRMNPLTLEAAYQSVNHAIAERGSTRSLQPREFKPRPDEKRHERARERYPRPSDKFQPRPNNNPYGNNRHALPKPPHSQIPPSFRQTYVPRPTLPALPPTAPPDIRADDCYPPNEHPPLPDYVPYGPKPPDYPPPRPALNKLSEEERAYCKQHNICFRCRQPGHRAIECPTKNSTGPTHPQQR
jgi:Retrotransposon gag protein/Zinc knuckle